MPNKRTEDKFELLPANGKPIKLYSENNGTLINEEEDQKPQYQFEDIIQSLGGCGRYQIRLTILMQLMKLPSCWSLFTVVFMNVIPRWTCADDLVDLVDHTNITWNENCTNKNGSKCTKFLFDKSRFNTFINEWNLVCDKDWIPYTILSIQVVGIFLGNMIAGILSDNIGRKKPIFISMIILIVTNGWAFLSTSWIEMAVIRFIMGLGAGFYVSVNNIIVSEVTLSGWRALTFALPGWPLEEWMIAGIIWLVPDWAYLHLITMVVVIPFLASWCFIMESIRWLIVKDRSEEADVIIHEIASINKHPYPGIHMVQAVAAKIKQTAEEAENKDDVSIVDLFKTKDLLKITLCLSFIWFTLGMGMYGIQFAISTMAGNIYVNMFLFSLISVVSQSTSSLLCHRLGRQGPIIFFFTTAGLGCLGAGIARLSTWEHAGMLSTAFAVAGYASFQAAWIGLMIITMELYPTVVRNRAYGFVNMLSRIGSIVAPQLSLFEIWVPGMLYFVGFGFCLLATVSSVSLPETKDIALKDQLYEKTQAEFTPADSCDHAE